MRSALRAIGARGTAGGSALVIAAVAVSGCGSASRPSAKPKSRAQIAAGSGSPTGSTGTACPAPRASLTSVRYVPASAQMSGAQVTLTGVFTNDSPYRLDGVYLVVGWPTASDSNPATSTSTVALPGSLAVAEPHSSVTWSATADVLSPTTDSQPVGPTAVLSIGWHWDSFSTGPKAACPPYWSPSPAQG